VNTVPTLWFVGDGKRSTQKGAGDPTLLFDVPNIRIPLAYHPRKIVLSHLQLLTVKAVWVANICRHFSNSLSMLGIEAAGK
jgi:hypothetical protein